jgi:hypothetical protein
VVKNLGLSSPLTTSVLPIYISYGTFLYKTIIVCTYSNVLGVGRFLHPMVT